MVALKPDDNEKYINLWLAAGFCKRVRSGEDEEIHPSTAKSYETVLVGVISLVWTLVSAIAANKSGMFPRTVRTRDWVVRRVPKRAGRRRTMGEGMDLAIFAFVATPQFESDECGNISSY